MTYLVTNDVSDQYDCYSYTGILPIGTSVIKFKVFESSGDLDYESMFADLANHVSAIGEGV